MDFAFLDNSLQNCFINASNWGLLSLSKAVKENYDDSLVEINKFSRIFLLFYWRENCLCKFLAVVKSENC